MRKDYISALRMGEAAVRKAARQGVSPYLPALDAFEEVKQNSKQSYVGLVELPLDRIKGNKETARNNAFANNFMPLLAEDSEFGVKWSNLYDSFKQEGIRDAIKVYEYMHNFYVQEGNKRVSVSKYENVDFILADVTRILPEKNDSKEVTAYYEYLDFYKVTKNIYIVLTEPGEYRKLAELLGQDLEHEWTEDLRKDLEAAYSIFANKCRSILKINDSFMTSEIFLIYVSIFSMKSLLAEPDDQIVRNIIQARDELLGSNDIEDIVFLDRSTDNTEEKRVRGLRGLFSGGNRYTGSNPLRVAFIYETQPDDSRWTDSHEAGRLYLSEMTGDEVVTETYVCGKGEDGIAGALEDAVSDKAGLVFTVSPRMMSETVKAAVKHQDVKFLNCSIGSTSSTVRSYHGKLYEASFLMGILTADLLLKDGKAGGEQTIGYLVRNFGNLSMASMNAFAIGVSLIDPDCRISMKYAGNSGTYDYRSEWAKEGAGYYADFEYSLTDGGKKRPGVYRIEGDSDTYIGTPYYHWGRFYTQIVNSVLNGEWDTQQLMAERTAKNYWFGLSTGVVDIRIKELPYQTRKLLSFFRASVIAGNVDPFSGELRSQSGVIQEDPAAGKNGVSSVFDTLSAAKIASMDWMNDNIL
ncbi:MAG TPA: hypothetical protein DCZ52_02205 [Lachnospiraceae bacterium]|nr:hypothetical protein [Lachnospiraceae bacterium]